MITGSRPLVATAYDLDPQLGSDAYNGEGQGYLHAVYLPSVRNWGANGSPTLYVQNPCCDTAHDIVSYYNSAGALIATPDANPARSTARRSYSRRPSCRAASRGARSSPPTRIRLR